MRKTLDYVVSTDGRDKNKVFRITEMPSRQAERWGMRAINVIAKTSGGISPAIMASGMQGLAAVGISAFARATWDDIEPLMDEMFTCIQIVPDPSKPMIVRPLIEDDIEEVATRALLRQEVLEMHLGFFKAAVNWILTAARQSLQQLKAADDLPSTGTSNQT